MPEVLADLLECDLARLENNRGEVMPHLVLHELLWQLESQTRRSSASAWRHPVLSAQRVWLTRLLEYPFRLFGCFTHSLILPITNTASRLKNFRRRVNVSWSTFSAKYESNFPKGQCSRSRLRWAR